MPWWGCCQTGNLAKKFKASGGRRKKGKKEQKKVCLFAGDWRAESAWTAPPALCSLLTSSASLPPSRRLSPRPVFLPEIARRETEDERCIRKILRIWQVRRWHRTCLPAESSQDESTQPARWGDTRESLFACRRAFSPIQNPEAVKPNYFFKQNTKISIHNWN